MSTPVKLRHRPARIVPSALVALVLAAIGVALVVVVVLGLAQSSWSSQLQRVDSAVGQSAWSSWPVLTAGAVLALVGLVLVIAALTPGRHNATPLTDPGAGGAGGSSELVLGRASLARLAAAHAEQVEEVDQVTAAATPTRVRLTVRSAATSRPAVADTVRRQVTEGLTRAGLVNLPRVDVDVRPTRR